MASDQRKRRRTNLWHRNPHCHWCGCLTVLPPDGVEKRPSPPDNEATLDHIVSRYVRAKGQRFSDGANTTLSCWRCNNLRCSAEQRDVPLEELWNRAHPLKIVEVPKPEPESLFLSLTSVEELLASVS